MYRLIRNTHLILGLFTVLFLLTYAISAVQMAHRIRLATEVSEQDLMLAAGMEARPLAQQLMEQRGYTGELGVVQPSPEGFRFNITRAGTVYTVTYDRASGRAHIRKEARDFIGILNRLHHLHGVRHEYGVMNVWGWALAFVSVTLLVLGGSGIYMWFHLHKERVIGSILLAANLGISIGLLAMLRS